MTSQPRRDVATICESGFKSIDEIGHGQEHGSDLKILPLGKRRLDDRSKEMTDTSKVMQLYNRQRRSASRTYHGSGRGTKVGCRYSGQSIQKLSRYSTSLRHTPFFGSAEGHFEQ